MSISRVTIADIAAASGVSKGAVSYALNSKPGVSDETRKRVINVAQRLGWSPSPAARTLAGARAYAIGLVLARPARTLGLEPFYMEFIAGIEEAIAPLDVTLMLHMVPDAAAEIRTYEKWWAERRVDGVLLVDLMEKDDPRVETIRRLGIPAVCVSSAGPFEGLSHLWTDDDSAMCDAVRYLIRLGHRRLARVGGIPLLSHTVVRDRAFRRFTQEAGMDEPVIVDTDFSGEAGARATRSLLTSPAPPTAIVYDNDIMAVAGLGVAAELHVRVPDELSLLAWDDSPLCEITHPSLSAMKRSVPAFGVEAADLLLTSIDTGKTERREGQRPQLYPRASTAAPS